MKRLFKGEAYRLTGYGIVSIFCKNVLELPKSRASSAQDKFILLLRKFSSNIGHLN
jgi:hypothetical protein